MSFLTVRHVTVYRYSQPVRLGEHRMMFRPRESHDLRLLKSRLEITPHPAEVRWLHDVFDNSVAIATFKGSTRELRFDSTVALEHVETALPTYPLEEYAETYPFRYADDERPDLDRALAHHYPSDEVGRWVQQFLDPSGTTGTMHLLRSISLGIRRDFVYMRRTEKGVQSPQETLHRRRGSCRDFAVLMMEAARSLGLAARFVSGYIFASPSETDSIAGALPPGTAILEKTNAGSTGSALMARSISSGEAAPATRSALTGEAALMNDAALTSEAGTTRPALIREAASLSDAVSSIEAARAIEAAIIREAARASETARISAAAPHEASPVGGGSTHAWMQAYLPGTGWLDFDPTNSIVGNRNLIRVAVAWDPKQALPLWGTFIGAPSSFQGMDVTVSVTEDRSAQSRPVDTYVLQT